MNWISVTSGKGGTGKTVLAASLACVLAEHQKKVLLFDGDLGLANADVVMGVEIGCTLGHVIRDGRELRDAVTASRHGVDVISGGSGWLELENLDLGAMAHLVTQLQALAKNYDFVVVDTSPGWGGRVMPFLLPATHMVLVTTPDATSLMDAYALLKAVWVQNESLAAGLVVNMADSELHGDQIAKQVQAVVAQFLSQPLPHIGTVRRDGKVVSATRQRTPFVKMFASSKVTSDLESVAEFFLDPSEVEAEPESMLEKLKLVFSKKSDEDEAEAA